MVVNYQKQLVDIWTGMDNALVPSEILSGIVCIASMTLGGTRQNVTIRRVQLYIVYSKYGILIMWTIFRSGIIVDLYPNAKVTVRNLFM